VTVVQDPASAESPIMPESAIEAVSPNYILSIENMPQLLMKLGREP
jgi:two-component system chemotaxis response regulator CheB